MPRQHYVAAIDQGTTSSRCIVFDQPGNIISVAQREHRQIFPKPGWVEHDADEIWQAVQVVLAEAVSGAGIEDGQIAALGITNQRETTVLWDRETGRPVCPAVVWQDTRTDALTRALAEHESLFKERAGLPLTTYFAGPKIRWLLDAYELRERAERGEVLFGTVDSWLLWNLTGRHITDVTNASRTMLMNIHTLAWDDDLLAALGVPRAMLPEIRPSAEIYGRTQNGVPVASALGDQQAALFGQTCFAPGETKSTYGSGSFLLMNTGQEPVRSKHGLLTTVGYQIGDGPATYALEGAIAVTGSLVQWLRDNLGLISSAAEIETLAKTVDDNGGCYFVPAFSGLFAPHWRSDARGVIAGLTGFVNKGHIARAVLEATAWQTREVVDAMNADSGLDLTTLRADGGMTADNLLMQTLADVLAVPVIRPMVAETTALGAAYAAGLATGYWPDIDSLRANWHKAAEWRPAIDEPARAREYRNWKKAVARTLDWVEQEGDPE
ncbi:glycerol kinase GlpK [Nonomuraea sp. K274]|uniref:Glycerol kinase n=1 Tax=Nonomuraea cypriaca TaxID=1187855 RepID=A0A931F0R5_9ACTN|nr:glycerol kinase GlpK [Nonomuraea cypriaca]MBF8189710.1 glycerol kinase GlpK [Nonomuraea cypriaca]